MVSGVAKWANVESVNMVVQVLSSALRTRYSTTAQAPIVPTPSCRSRAPTSASSPLPWRRCAAPSSSQTARSTACAAAKAAQPKRETWPQQRSALGCAARWPQAACACQPRANAWPSSATASGRGRPALIWPIATSLSTEPPFSSRWLVLCCASPPALRRRLV